ncbi:hypothetical protein EDC04DRAFT_2901414 [Pisolithus marmoratus]|nr:hypothetical protein EDC04DRAFT_2901414 [Pisolithus marmoratus]
MHSSKSHPALTFYGADELPQPMLVLSSQVEMYYQPKTHVHVSAMEEMVVSHLPSAIFTANAKSPAKIQCMSTPRMSSRAGTPRDVTPVTKCSDKVVEKSVTILEDKGETSNSPSSSESSLSSWDDDEESHTKKIPKPNGEVGQLGQGGYNLKDQLGWGEDGFKKLKRFIKKAVKKHLDPMRCRSLQDRKALETVSKMAIAEFPDLDDFNKCWPVQDLVQLQLKYLSFRAWQQQQTRVTPPGEGIKTNMRSQRG